MYKFWVSQIFGIDEYLVQLVSPVSTYVWPPMTMIIEVPIKLGKAIQDEFLLFLHFLLLCLPLSATLCPISIIDIHWAIRLEIWV